MADDHLFDRYGRRNQADGKAGFSQEQAEAIVETFVRSKDALITKADLDKLEVRIMVPIVTGQVATVAILFTLLKLFP